MNNLFDLKLRTWGAILWRRWEKLGNTAQVIVGYWAEDGSEYKMIVPPQLRDLIVEIQNYFSDIYVQIEALKTKIKYLEETFKKGL